MTALIQIDPGASARAKAPIDGLAPSFAEEAELAWLCSFCGLLRIYEGGCPGGRGQNECRECGGRLAANPEDPAAVAKCDKRRRGVGALVDADLL